jgi:hypothetical protein
MQAIIRALPCVSQVFEGSFLWWIMCAMMLLIALHMSHVNHAKGKYYCPRSRIHKLRWHARQKWGPHLKKWGPHLKIIKHKVQVVTSAVMAARTMAWHRLKLEWAKLWKPVWAAAWKHPPSCHPQPRPPPCLRRLIRMVLMQALWLGSPESGIAGEGSIKPEEYWFTKPAPITGTTPGGSACQGSLRWQLQVWLIRMHIPW